MRTDHLLSHSPILPFSLYISFNIFPFLSFFIHSFSFALFLKSSLPPLLLQCSHSQILCFYYSFFLSFLHSLFFSFFHSLFLSIFFISLFLCISFTFLLNLTISLCLRVVCNSIFLIFWMKILDEGPLP